MREKSIQYIPDIFRDERLQKLKNYLIQTVAQEMQNRPQQDRQAVRQWLVSALERSRAEIPEQVRDQILEAALADLIG